MKEELIALLNKATAIAHEDIAKSLEVPKDSSLGDYAFPCFIVAKQQKKNPVEIAAHLAKSLAPPPFIEKIEAKGPYVNFFIDRKFLAKKTISEILEKKGKYGSSNLGKGIILIEFSQANTHKAFHIGHVRGTSIGESLARISEFTGQEVIRANYQGDTGMHVAKWIWCYHKYHKGERLKKDEGWIASIYVEAVQKLDENPSLQTEVDEINQKLDSRSDEELNSLWQKTRELSLEAFKVIYKDLGTHFDKLFFESRVENRGREIAQELIQKKIAEISEGATIIKLDKFNLGVWVLLRKDGTVLYSAKDLALAEEKSMLYKLTKSIHVVGTAQMQHFYQLFKTLELMGISSPEKVYIPVTEVRLPTGKMSSRTGENILYSDFKKEIVGYAKEEILKREKIGGKELDKRALAIAISSLKYAMLKQDLNKVIVFSKEEALSFEGNTGPYLLYTYARAKSIINKSKNKVGKLDLSFVNDSDKSLLSLLNSFPDVIIHASANLDPGIIANYAYHLAQTFNEFYHREKVIGSQQESFRLALVAATAQVLKNALYLLGIPVLEKM